MITYHEPTAQQIQLVKKLFHYQQQIDKSETIENIKHNVLEAHNSIQSIPSASYTFHDGSIKNFDFAKENFSHILITDLDTYSQILDMKVGIILTLDLLMSTFIVGREKLLEVLKAM